MREIGLQHTDLHTVLQLMSREEAGVEANMIKLTGRRSYLNTAQQPHQSSIIMYESADQFSFCDENLP